MAARTPPRLWEDLFAQQNPAWLAAVDPSWDLFALADDEWVRLKVEAKIAAALSAMFGIGRRLSVVTKVLHMKRPNLIPVCDGLVLRRIGAPPGVDRDAAEAAALIGHLRKEGRRNLRALREIQKVLAHDDYDRSLVRIFEALIWQSHPAEWGNRLAPLIDQWLTQASLGEKAR